MDQALSDSTFTDNLSALETKLKEQYLALEKIGSSLIATETEIKQKSQSLDVFKQDVLEKIKNLSNLIQSNANNFSKFKEDILKNTKQEHCDLYNEVATKLLAIKEDQEANLRKENIKNLTFKQLLETYVASASESLKDAVKNTEISKQEISALRDKIPSGDINQALQTNIKEINEKLESTINVVSTINQTNNSVTEPLINEITQIKQRIDNISSSNIEEKISKLEETVTALANNKSIEKQVLVLNENKRNGDVFNKNVTQVLQTLQKEVERLKREAFSVGIIAFWPTENIPVNWLLCNGQKLKKREYPELFEKLGYKYGGTEDEFHLPDARRKFIRSWGEDNREIGSDQEDSIKTHKHFLIKSTLEELKDSNDLQNLQGDLFSFWETVPVSSPQLTNTQYGIGKEIVHNEKLSGLGSEKVGPFLSIGPNAEGETETRPHNISFACCIKVR